MVMKSISMTGGACNCYWMDNICIDLHTFSGEICFKANQLHGPEGIRVKVKVLRK
jgi:hypothetical protein